jgi:hypothetical protein
LMGVDLVVQSDWFKALLWQLTDPLCLAFVTIETLALCPGSER